MFQSKINDMKTHQSCTYLESSQSFIDNQQSKDSSFRKRLHTLMTQNFGLKESVTCLQMQLKSSEEERRELKEQLRIVLEEMAGNDKILQTHKHSQIEQRNINKRLEEELSALQEQILYEKDVIKQLMDHTRNLQTQNQLIIEIKQKYVLDLTKLKAQYDSLHSQHQRLSRDNEFLTLQINRLLQQIAHLQQQMQTRRNDIEQYQKFVMQRLSQAKNSDQFHESCKSTLSTLHSKYCKYKQKACLYKRERDQLLSHLQHFSQQMNGSTLRRYYEQVQ